MNPVTIVLLGIVVALLAVLLCIVLMCGLDIFSFVEDLLDDDDTEPD